MVEFAPLVFKCNQNIPLIAEDKNMKERYNNDNDKQRTKFVDVRELIYIDSGEVDRRKERKITIQYCR